MSVTCGPRSGRFLTPLSSIRNICFANSVIVALPLRFPLQMRPRPNKAVAVALPGILDPLGPHHYKCSFCNVENHNTRDFRRKNRTCFGPDCPSRTIEITNAVTLALANLFTNSTPAISGPSIKDPSLSYNRCHVATSWTLLPASPCIRPLSPYNAMKSPARQFFLPTSAVSRPSVKANPLSILWAVTAIYREPSTYPFLKIASSQPHKSPRNTTYSFRALIFTYCPLDHVTKTPSSSPTVTAQMACTSYTYVAMKQRLLTTTGPFHIPTNILPLHLLLIISLPVLCLAFSSSNPHSNLPTMRYEQSSLYPAPLALRTNRPVPPLGPLTHRFPVSFHVYLRNFVAPFPSRPKAHATYKFSSTTSPSTPLAYSYLKSPKRPLAFPLSSVPGPRPRAYQSRES
jgi:hypothetical protein